MNSMGCDREPEAVRALRTGAWPAELREHVNLCRHCADALVVTEFLQHEAHLVQALPDLPAAGLFWWKGQLRRREQRVQQATRAIALVRNLAIIVFGAIVLWSFSVSVPFAQQLIGPVSATPSLSATAVRIVLILSLACCVACAVFGSIYLLWADRRELSTNHDRR